MRALLFAAGAGLGRKRRPGLCGRGRMGRCGQDLGPPWLRTRETGPGAGPDPKLTPDGRIFNEGMRMVA